MSKTHWETVAEHDMGFRTERLKVVGGWLVVNRKDHYAEPGFPVFLNDPEHTWEI